MAVLKTTSPERSAGAPKLLPSKTVPSSRARIAESNNFLLGIGVKTIVRYSVRRADPRVIQCKMILKRDLTPMQDDPENGSGRIGVQKRPDANTHAVRRSPDGAADRRVFDRQHVGPGIHA